MIRPIDGNALIELINGGYDLDFNEVPETKRELIRMIMEQPTVDAVPVVRCKDCKYHFYDEKYDVAYCSRKDYGYGWKDDDYCSMAVRKKE
jgi:hypothetical protein